MKKMLPIFFVVFLIVFFILSFLIPSFAKTAQKKRSELRLLQNEETVIPLAKGLLTTKKEQIALLEASFPTKEELISAVQYFDSQAAASGVLAELHFESEDIEQNPSGDAVVPVKITIEGNFANVLVFLETLEKGKYFYGIDIIEGDSPGGIRGKNKVTVRANLYATK